VTKTDDFLEGKKKGRAKEPFEKPVFLLHLGLLRQQDEKKTRRSFGNKSLVSELKLSVYNIIRNAAYFCHVIAYP
jgi:hypothetical protein